MALAEAPEIKPPSRLSPSAASLYRQCPLKWKMKYIDRFPDPAGEAQIVGTFAHSVLELLLQKTEAERTVAVAKQLARELWPALSTTEDFLGLGLSDDQERQFRWRAWLAIEGLWTLEDPTQVDVYSTEQDIRVDLDGTPFRGIIDRVDVTREGLVVSDYKSGKAKAKRWSADAHAQILLYAAALGELTEQRPIRARLLYLGQQTVDLKVTDANASEAVDQLGATWASLSKDCAQGEFEPAPGPLCGWCPYVEHCPAGSTEVRRRYDSGRMRADAPALKLLAST